MLIWYHSSISFYKNTMPVLSWKGLLGLSQMFICKCVFLYFVNVHSTDGVEHVALREI